MPNVSPNIKGRGGGGSITGKSKLAGNKNANKRASNKKGLQCNFCNIGNEEEKVFGKLHTLENVSAHYNCLLFSSGLGQNGEEEEGIEGFFLEDIKKELRRSTKLKCCYCRQNGASIGCLERRCKRSYHFLCGLKAFALFQFTGNFCSYCVDHRPFQEGANRGKEVECPICMEELIADPKIAVWASCCKKDDWFHKDCVQNMANSAGYFFKCPLCNDKDTFTESMQLSGIHVPEQDAVWESEPNAFSDLYERRIHCDAPVCKCPEGRKQDDLGTRWEILLCDLCGTTGVHIVCGKLPFTCTKWNCSLCLEMLEESSKRSKEEMRQRRLKERKERTSIDKGRVGRLSLNATISESNPSHRNASNASKGRGGRGRGRLSLNATIADISPSKVIITSPSTRRGRGKRKAVVQNRDKGKRNIGAQQSIKVIADCSPSRTVKALPSTPKRRRTSESLVLPRKMARIENTPIKELKRALLTPNKEPFVELKRINITNISVAVDIEVDVGNKMSGVSRSLNKLMECENTTSSDIKYKEMNSFGANDSDLNCDIISCDTLKVSDLDIKNVIKGKDVAENENSRISIVDENVSISILDENDNSSVSVPKIIMPNINEEKDQNLSTEENLRRIEENGGELSESAIELKNFALTAQGIMNDLQLTEAEVLDIASKIINKETLTKSDISRFFRYNLSIKKMMEIKNVLESVFAERRDKIKSAQYSSKKRSKSVSPKISKDNSLSYATFKEKEIISEIRNLYSSQDNVAHSVSAKKPDSPVKCSNQVKIDDGTFDSTKCNNKISKKGHEELEKKSSDNILTDSPKKVDKLVIKMRSSPRKHIKTPPANVLFSKTVETNMGTTTKTTNVHTIQEETGSVSKSVMGVSCGNPIDLSTIDTPTTTSPRSSFGSPSLLGSPRKLPKSRIASPEKIAQGCILMWDEDSDEITDVPSKNEDDLKKNSKDNSSIVDNTSQEMLMLNSVAGASNDGDNVLSDTRLQCIENLVPISNQTCTVVHKSTLNGEIEENEKDGLLTSPANNSINDDNEHQEEHQHCSTESSTSETISNILPEPRYPASNKTPCDSQKVNRKGSLKSLRVVQPESKLRILRVVK